MDTLTDIISGLKWGELDPVEAHDRIMTLMVNAPHKIKSGDFYSELMKLINAHVDDGLSKPELIQYMTYALQSCKFS